MRNLLALIGLFVVLFAAVGWYCGWYTLSIHKSGEGKLQIQTEVNTTKVTHDTSGFFQTLGRVLSEKVEKSSPPATAPGSTPGPVAPTPAPPAPAVPTAPAAAPGGPAAAPIPGQPQTPWFDAGWLFSSGRPPVASPRP